MEVRSVETVGQVFRVDQLAGARGPEIALVGRSNVGKSSLINRLIGRHNLARVAKAPGKTRGAFFYSVNRDRLIVVDLPGYGYAAGARRERGLWEQLVQQLLERPGERLLLQLVDLRLPPQDLDLEAAEWFDQLVERRLLVGTKADKLPHARGLAQRRLLEQGLGRSLVAVSAKTGAGLRELWKEIDEFVGGGKP